MLGQKVDKDRGTLRSSCRCGENWLGSGYNLKVESMSFADGYVRYERKEEVKNDSQGFWL